MKQILVGMDGSEGAQAAMRWAGELAKGTNSQVLVAGVFEPTWSNLPTERWEAERGAWHEQLAGWTEELAAKGVPFDTDVLDSLPGPGLLHAADEHDADVIVLGRRGAGGFAGLTMGSVVDFVAHHASRPVAVVPVGWEGGAPHNIVVGVDGSAGGEHAAHLAAELARDTGATVLALAVGYHPLAWVPDTDERSWHRKTEEMLEGPWTDAFRAAGVTLETLVEANPHPADALIDAAGRVGADLLVVGTRSVGEATGIRLGGVTMSLIRNARVPVLIVPPGERR